MSPTTRNGASFKQLLSTPNAARMVTASLQRVYGNGQRLVMEIENHCETFGESLEIFMNDDHLKGLRKEDSMLRCDHSKLVSIVGTSRCHILMWPTG